MLTVDPFCTPAILEGHVEALVASDVSTNKIMALFFGRFEQQTKYHTHIHTPKLLQDVHSPARLEPADLGNLVSIHAALAYPQLTDPPRPSVGPILPAPVPLQFPWLGMTPHWLSILSTSSHPFLDTFPINPLQGKYFPLFNI